MQKSLVIVENEICVSIAADQDVVAARQQGRAMALELGFSASDSTLLATAISELARNIVSYAGQGEICFRVTQNSGRPSITVTARDNGPGIGEDEPKKPSGRKHAHAHA